MLVRPSILALAVGGLSTPAVAQEATVNAADDGNVIVVTGQRTYYDSLATSATRVDLPILETPQSIFVINEDLIADQQAFRLDQILQNDSSVQKSGKAVQRPTFRSGYLVGKNSLGRGETMTVLWSDPWRHQ